MISLALTLDTLIISDTHWGHENIIRHCNRPGDHNERMLENWREATHNGNPVLHLGDCVWKCWPEGLCQEICNLPRPRYLILGNHDRRKKGLQTRLGFEIVPTLQTVFIAGVGNVIFSHRPLEDHEGGAWTLNIHGHIHNDPYPAALRRSKRRHWNVSVEVMGYTPRPLGEIVEGSWGQGPDTLGFWDPKEDPEKRGEWGAMS